MSDVTRVAATLAPGIAAAGAPAARASLKCQLGAQQPDAPILRPPADLPLCQQQLHHGLAQAQHRGQQGLRARGHRQLASGERLGLEHAKAGVRVGVAASWRLPVLPVLPCRLCRRLNLLLQLLGGIRQLLENLRRGGRPTGCLVCRSAGPSTRHCNGRACLQLGGMRCRGNGLLKHPRRLAQPAAGGEGQPQARAVAWAAEALA